MKQRHRKHRRPVRDTGWYACAMRHKPIQNLILLHPESWTELLQRVPVDPSVKLLHGEIGSLDCEFRILPLVPAQVHSVVVSETLEGLDVDPGPKPA